VSAVPLVTIKYQKPYYGEAFRLMEALPTKFVEEVQLGLEGDFPEEAVQVELIAFGEGKNLPHVWLKVRFTEPLDELGVAPGEIVHRLYSWMCLIVTHDGLLPDIAIDLFFGPTYGILDFAKDGERTKISW
jgi:hypothetical protein